jgi:hypothetical protein
MKQGAIDGESLESPSQFSALAGASSSRIGADSPAYFLESSMENVNRRASRKERWTSREEERVWIGFYRRVGDPEVASDLIEQMEADSEVKAQHLGLYLRCKQSLRREKARCARAKAIAHAVEALLRFLVIAPGGRLVGLWNFIGAICMNWLPESSEPAAKQMRKIRKAGAATKSSRVEVQQEATAKQA